MKATSEDACLAVCSCVVSINTEDGTWEQPLIDCLCHIQFAFTSSARGPFYIHHLMEMGRVWLRLLSLVDLQPVSSVLC